MPIYEYRCENCNHFFEQLVMSKKEIICPKCGGVSLEKQFSSFATKEASSGCEHKRSCESEGHCCGGHCHHG